MLLCVAGVSYFFSQGPLFLSGNVLAPSSQVEVSSSAALRIASAAAAPILAGIPTAAFADEELPTPILGIGIISVIVVLVLVVTGLVVARGLLDDEKDGDL